MKRWMNKGFFVWEKKFSKFFFNPRTGEDFFPFVFVDQVLSLTLLFSFAKL